MEHSIGSMLLLQVALIALNAIFACAEIAVISMNDNKLARLAAQGDRRAQRLARLTSQPAKFLATIQVAITLSGFLGSAFAAENFSDVLVSWLVDLGVGISPATLDTIAVILITLALSYFTLVFGELVPKRVAMRKAEALALGLSGLISAISRLFAPIVWFLSLSTNAILRLLHIDPDAEDEQVSEEEIRMMVDVGSEQGAIDQDEKEFIQNVFAFDDLTAEDIATHRTDVDFLRLEDPMDAWTRTIHNTRHTLYPVCENDPDSIVGILNAKDYFRLDDKSRAAVLAGAVHPAYFVPATIPADDLFRNMKRARSRLAVVLDEYGGMVGIVTLSDLVEQLVGELDADAPQILRLDAQTWQLLGNVALDDLARETSTALDCHGCDTLTGLVFHTLGHIPDDGPHQLELALPPLHIHISSIREHQIAEATVRLLPTTPDTASDAQ